MEGSHSSLLEGRGCPVLFSSPTCGTYSQPLESRVQLHVNGVQRLQVLPVLYVSVEKKERLSCGTQPDGCSARAGDSPQREHVMPHHPAPHLFPPSFSQNLLATHLGIGPAQASASTSSDTYGTHHAAKTSSFSCCFLFCFPSALGEPNNVVLTTVSSAECAIDPLNILAQVIAPLCTSLRTLVKHRHDQDSSHKRNECKYNLSVKIWGLNERKKKVLFIQSLPGVEKEGPSHCWLEVLLAGEHQTSFENRAFIINSSVAQGALAGML